MNRFHSNLKLRHENMRTSHAAAATRRNPATLLSPHALYSSRFYTRPRDQPTPRESRDAPPRKSPQAHRNRSTSSLLQVVRATHDQQQQQQQHRLSSRGCLCHPLQVQLPPLFLSRSYQQKPVAATVCCA
ncbi:hypothetical protein M758_8G179700 [Ceratodon purpureus]|nr:hypothetical protein M758_8G179700 [Ceratodon purpureus]